MQQKISISELEQVKRPIAEAKGLPNLTYTDRELFEFERIFFHWLNLFIQFRLPRCKKVLYYLQREVDQSFKNLVL